MKPAPFEYRRPEILDQALEILAEYGDEAKILAGGQSLVPAMNFRLAQPSLLVDINRLDELAYIDAGDNESNDGGLHIGAMTRQRAVECSSVVAESAPLIHQAMPYVAHVQIRNRGTVGGSLAHADPAAELPAILVALDARMRAQSKAGQRWLAASDFFTGLFATALRPEEMLVGIEVPRLADRSGHAFIEFARRHGDYAVVGVAVQVTVDSSGRCHSARVVLMSVGDRPIDAQAAAAVVSGQKPSVEVIREAAAIAGSDEIDPHSDVHASSDYRRHLARVLTSRALEQAFTRAGVRVE
ncbi:MAG: xanthine dehydrogenase family protein subunit M [Proteobacteria bacterium]|nr:xanthine dehydrogenase family protein subunit M [Pseudomonadota bacterium]